jgi:prevent-host-death family protein
VQAWRFKDAKARLSEVLKLAQRQGPQEITVHGRSAAVVLSRENYDKLVARKPSFVSLMRASPLVGLELEIERDTSPPRDVTRLYQQTFEPKCPTSSRGGNADDAIQYLGFQAGSLRYARDDAREAAKCVRAADRSGRRRHAV